MAKVVIYTTPVCYYCVQAKRLLSGKGVAFEEIDVSRDAQLRGHMVHMAGGRLTVPQIFVNGRHIGDCEDIYALEKEGRLDAALNTS
jgi:glutaredoxin 3